MSPRILLTIIVLFNWSIASVYGQTGQEILDECDKTINNFKDRTLILTLTMIESDGSERSIDFDILQKGLDKRLILFKSGVEEGRGILITGANQMFIYLPNYHKIRSLAAHVKNQSFGGTDLTLDDISAVDYSPYYTATKVGETDTENILDLIPKPDANIDWKRLKVWIYKDKKVFSKLEYYDKEDRLQKTWIREDYQLVDGVWVAYYNKMTDHGKKHTTVMKINKALMNTGLEDDLFTKKGLIRGK
jgi:hypothetical protein